MKRINWKVLNCAFWIEITLSYVLPFSVHGSSQYRVGFPIPFLTIHDGNIGVNPFMSMHLDPLSLLIDGIIIYLIIGLAVKIISFLKKVYGHFRGGKA